MSSVSYDTLVQEGINSLNTASSDPDKYVSSAIVDMYEYAGFDPVAALVKLGAVVGFQIEEVKELIFIYLTRGTKIDKIKKKSAPDASTRIDELLTKYKLSSSRVMGTSDLNLPRLAACFPTICVGIIGSVKGIKRVVTCAEMQSKLLVAYPVLLTSCSILGIMPVTVSCYRSREEMGMIPKIVTMYTVYETKVLGQGEVRKKTEAEIYLANAVYVRLAWSSAAVPEDKRLAICNSSLFKSLFLIADGKLVFTSEVTTVYEAMKAKCSDCLSLPWD